jgi:hypothetical protein
MRLGRELKADTVPFAAATRPADLLLAGANTAGRRRGAEPGVGSVLVVEAEGCLFVGASRT